MRSIRKIQIQYYAKEALKYLLLVGAVYVAASSPSFSVNLLRNVFNNKKISGRKFSNTFYYLKRKNLIQFKKEGHDICISLTKEGKKRAGKYQIGDLRLEKPKKWDRKWRIVIFDIPSSSNIIRNVFRRKLKEFGFYLLQKSVWIYPFDCREEIAFLRDFLGVNRGQIQFLEVSVIEGDNFLRKIFKL